PERVNKVNVPSGEWTFIEGIIPVYANVSNPQINFETPESGTPDFYLDNITIAFDPKSKVAANASYAQSAGSKKKLDKITLGFDDNNGFFTARGDGKPSIQYGGYDSEKCLFVSGRKSNWHGVSKNMTDDYSNIVGHTIEASFWLYHEYEAPLDVILSIEQVDDSNSTSYMNVVRATCPADGKWSYYTGTYYVPDNMKQVIFYFESPDATAEFYLDDVTFKVLD
ncbi:MAG: carbohydrate binding domain-containing protein, partial [Lachnospiraceae bacterium]|nr:carbohydrate binding domain-containing protein [Lachnospiraceae bacterium]